MKTLFVYACVYVCLYKYVEECMQESWCEFIYISVEVTPKEFEKHGAMEDVKGRNWTSSIWIQLEAKGKKDALGKSPVMKYYNHKANVDNWLKFVSRNKKFHNDLFVRCSKCNKKRRFRRRTMNNIKDHHDAVINSTWECSLWPYDKYFTSSLPTIFIYKLKSVLHDL